MRTYVEQDTSTNIWNVEKWFAKASVERYHGVDIEHCVISDNLNVETYMFCETLFWVESHGGQNLVYVFMLPSWEY